MSGEQERDGIDNLKDDDKYDELDSFIDDNDLKDEYIKEEFREFLGWIWESWSKELIDEYGDAYCDSDAFRDWAKEQYDDTPSFDEAHPPRPK